MKILNKPVVLTAILVAALALASAPRAAAQTGTISGQIMDINAKPWAGLTVQATSEQGAKSTAKTDNDGKYSIAGLRPGVRRTNRDRGERIREHRQNTQVTEGSIHGAHLRAKLGVERPLIKKKKRGARSRANLRARMPDSPFQFRAGTNVLRYYSSRPFNVTVICRRRRSRSTRTGCRES